MRGIFVLSVLLFLCVQCYAQKIRFNDTTNVWTVCDFKNTLSGGWLTHFKISKDTILNGAQYCYHNRYNAWIKEDTATRKWHYREHLDSADKIFLDFNMAVGDSVFFLNGIESIELLSIDSVLINGVYHRLLNFDRFPAVEGIGPAHPGVFPDASYYPVCCFQNNGVYPVLNISGWLDDNNCPLFVADVQKANAIASVLPNPLTPNSRIILPQLAEIAKLKIINTAGQRVVDKTFKHVREIPLGNYELPAGVYFYTVKDAETGKSFQGKFVVQ